MRRSIGMLVLLIIEWTVVPTAIHCQWEGYVTCHEAWIDLRPSDGWNGVIPRCMDTLRIGVTRAMKRHVSSANPVCARLFRLGVVGSPIQRQEIPTERVCEGPSQVTLIPSYHLDVSNSQDTPIRYEVQLYCTYWHGPGEGDTTRIVFHKATGFKAFARAVDSETGNDITTLGLVTPTILEKDHSVHDGMQLIAFSGEGYEFEYWTCSDSELLPDSRARRQLLDSLCWPVLRAVEYVGHFKKTSTTVIGQHSPCHQEIQFQGSTLSILNNCLEQGIVKVYDTHGRQVLMTNIESSHQRISTDSLAVGLYVAVAYGPHGTTTQSFMITKE
ncbi:MAG: T9SS type A sorting domain-containing protein [Candidatus Kapabacteria bacterium]|nr:T9SS type A sorting domain-containing protein [Candidatus Kapabacteria bacterium]